MIKTLNFTHVHVFCLYTSTCFINFDVPWFKKLKLYHDKSGLKFDPSCHTFASFFFKLPTFAKNDNLQYQPRPCQ